MFKVFIYVLMNIDLNQ